MKSYQIRTYTEAVKVIEEIGILPLSPVIPHYPALDQITPKQNWHKAKALQRAALSKTSSDEAMVFFGKLFAW